MKEPKDNPYLRKENDKIQITAAGYALLDSILTDSKGNVYVFNNEISPILVAAAMARLSRRGSDMRETFLDEFATSGEEGAEGLIKRVVTAYGDDSVQQLTGLHFVVENASIILAKFLEWGRLAAYLEQSTRYIFFDQKNAQGNYRYVRPDFPSKIGKEYIKNMDAIFELYSETVRAITAYVREKHPEPAESKERIAWLGATRAQACDACRPMLPAATSVTVGIYASAQSVESLIIHLLSETLPEAQNTGHQILTEARKVIPAFLERTDLPSRGGASTAYRANTRSAIGQLAQKYLKPTTQLPADLPEVSLKGHYPDQELDLIAELLFEQSNLSLAEIEAQVASWSAKRKKEVLQTYFGERFNRRHKPGRALEKAHFEWEITADYGTFRDLQRHRMLDAFEWQSLTPQYGYEVPALISEAGYTDQFKQVFALAEKLYTFLEKNGYPDEAQYATLLGHKMRYRFIANARSLFHFLELRTSPQGHPGYRRICNTIYQKFAEVYPLTAAAMQFVNRNEDPELTRLAAERATQFKLEKLEKQGIS